jgi:hypothetical protein
MPPSAGPSSSAGSRASTTSARAQVVGRPLARRRRMRAGIPPQSPRDNEYAARGHAPGCTPRAAPCSTAGRERPRMPAASGCRGRRARGGPLGKDRSGSGPLFPERA